MNKNQTMSLIAALLVVAAALAACSGGADTVSGTIFLPDGASVPEGATIKVQVQDTSLADAAAKTIGEQIIEGNGQTGTVDFSVEYNADDIQDNHTYGMNVRIEDASGSLLFINDTNINVITGGFPSAGVEVPVIEV